MLRRWTKLLGMLLSSGWCAGCGTFEWNYVQHAAVGQLRILHETEPIDQVLAAGRLSPEDADKLRFVVEVRRFAIEQMGLNGEGTYTTFYDTGGWPVAYNLSAARRDALVAKTWTFPIVGRVPYLGFFDKGRLDAYRSRLEGEGWDVRTYELDAYSLLGLLPNPVYSPMLARDEISLAEVIIHELLHNTIWRPGDVTFNESMATYVGRRGAIDFLATHFGADSPTVTLAWWRFEDVDRVEAFVAELHEELSAFYAQPISSQEKVEGREAIYTAARQRFAEQVLPMMNEPARYQPLVNLPTNNAWVLARRRYGSELDVFAAVHEATGRSWADTLGVYSQAAHADDAMGHLRDWLAGRR